MPLKTRAWNEKEQQLYFEAMALLRRRFRRGRHTVACALRTGSGAIYTGICVDGLHSPCAETIALGQALVNGEREVRAIVAVNRWGVIPPCGNCRQMLLDYVPQASVMVRGPAKSVAVRADDLLPFPFRTFPDP